MDGLIVVPLDDNCDRKLVAVEYPGFVGNLDAALTRLGGIAALSKAHYEGGKLELKFRPRDKHCKPATTKEQNESTLVLRIRRKKIKKGLHESSDCSVDVVGVINKCFQFTGMAEFQTLPPGLSSTDCSDVNYYQMNEPLESDYCAKEVSAFQTPSYFTKFDKPTFFLFRSMEETVPKSSSPVKEPPENAADN